MTAGFDMPGPLKVASERWDCKKMECIVAQYEIPPLLDFKIDLPPEAQILACLRSREKAIMCVSVPSEDWDRQKPRCFRLIPCFQVFDRKQSRYIGSFQFAGLASFEATVARAYLSIGNVESVLHLFEVTEE